MHHKRNFRSHSFIVSPLELTSSNFIAGSLFKMVTDRPIGAQPVFIEFRHRYSNFISDHSLTIQWQYYVHAYAYVHVNSSLLFCVFIIITIVVVTIIFHGGVGWGMKCPRLSVLYADHLPSSFFQNKLVNNVPLGYFSSINIHRKPWFNFIKISTNTLIFHDIDECKHRKRNDLFHARKHTTDSHVQLQL